ncbi:alcohol dehydrogenase 1 [Lactuca sativa]|uniref:alcohol dehydrogenase 1 n=1 Tax=Lactuca sativa TaxID=4236 RepID=UPI001C6915BE|nr:alcohol dehydrogenase 1 [Lactuca sativa]
MNLHIIYGMIEAEIRNFVDRWWLLKKRKEARITEDEEIWETQGPITVVVGVPDGLVTIKILFTSLCHIDVYFWEAKGQNALFPRIFGHEVGGVVESVGEGVTELQPGDHVLPVFTGECKECAHCKSEESNMCDLLRINTDRGVMINDQKYRFSINGKPLFHFVGTSTFSEYTVVHVGYLAEINPLAPLDNVCILSCGISTSIKRNHSILRLQFNWCFLDLINLRVFFRSCAAN